jgi:tRNA (cmo5U34)-methyltransferase
MLSQFLPAASFHLVDLSDAMLERARARFGVAEEGRFSFELGDLTEYESADTYHAIVSGLAIHHLSDDDKRSLYARIRRWLEPGGVFVNVEQVLGPTPELERRYDAVWQRQVLANGGTPDMIERTKTRMAFDRAATVEDQVQWLREAGFAQADCTFKSWRFAVLAGWT